MGARASQMLRSTRNGGSATEVEQNGLILGFVGGIATGKWNNPCTVAPGSSCTPTA